MFYMPLVVACIHTAFAFPIVSKLMAMLSMGNTRLFIVSLICIVLDLCGILYDDLHDDRQGLL